MRLYWGFALGAALALTSATVASGDIQLHISLAYQTSVDGAGNSATLPSVAVPGGGASLTQVNITPGGPYVNHVFNVYATVTGLTSDQDVTFMLFGGTGSGGVTTGGSASYTANSYTVDPPAMGSPASDAPAASWYDTNGFNGAGYTVALTMGTSTGGDQGNTYGDYAAYMHLGVPGPFLIGQQILTCNSSGGYNFIFRPNGGYLKIISGNTDGDAANFLAESYPVYSGIGDSALFAPRAPTDLTWADGAASTWAFNDGTQHWTQTANPSTPDNFYHLDTVRFTDAAVTDRTVTLSGNLNPTSVIVSSSGDYTFTGSGAIVGTGTTLTKSGAGKLTINNTGTNTYTGRTTLQGGTLQLSGAGAQNPVLNLGGADIQAGKLVFDYSAGGSAADPTNATILPLLKASGTTSSPWTSGQFRSSTAAQNGTTLGWIDNTTASPIVSGLNTFAPYSVTVMATIAGDCNLNGTVDQNDFDIVLGNFGSAGGWAQGDFNYNGVIDQNDFDLVLGNFGSSFDPAPVYASGAGFSPVPEPGTLALLGCGLFGLIAYAWRKRK